MVAACVLPGVCRAQASPSPDSIHTRRDCWRGAPLPYCRRFWLTEAAFEGPVAATHATYTSSLGTGSIEQGVQLESILAWSAGPMVNTSPTSAFGGTVTIGGANAGTRLAVEGRYRRWTGSSGAFDVSTGLARAVVGNGLAATGITASASIGRADLISATARADVMQLKGKTVAATYLGVRLGTKPAVIGTLLVAAVVGALAIAFLSAGPYT